MEDKIKDFLSRYKVGDLIYPGTIKRKLKTDIKSTYKILEKLCNENLLDINYEIYCPKCNQPLGIVTVFNQISEYAYCDKCNEDVEITLSDVIVIYRVKKQF